MADKKVTQLTDLGDGIASADLFHVIDDPTGTPINKKISAEDVFNNIPTWIGMKGSSQALTTDGSTTVAANITAAITEVNATAAIGTVSLADGSVKSPFEIAADATKLAQRIQMITLSCIHLIRIFLVMCKIGFKGSYNFTYNN